MLQSGLYGKVPALGDFFVRRLPGEFCEPWDQWLQQVVAALHAREPERWGAIFDGWPAYCFTLDAGTCGPVPVIGVVVPSRDRVGRRFPLTLAVALAPGWDPLAVALGAERWRRLGLALLRDACSPSGDPVAFERGLEELDRALVDVEGAPGVDLNACRSLFAESGGWQVELAPGAGLAHHLGGLALAELRRGTSGLAVLWPLGGGGPLLASRGLPAPSTAAGLLSSVLVPVPAAPQPSAPPPPPPPSASLAALIQTSAPVRSSAPVAGEGLPEQCLIAAPGIAYLACAGWRRDGAADGPIATRFRDGFGAAHDAAKAVEAAFAGPARVSAGGAAWVPDEDGGHFAWFGNAAIFRLRGGELTRFAAPEQNSAETSLADLLGGGSTEAPQAAVHALPADVQDGDRLLLCADGSYGKLSWGQLMSALQESLAERATSRLAEVWNRPEARVPGAIVLAFDLTGEGLEATHSLVQAPPTVAT
jgi:type VI secretion system protein ImpM